MGLRQAAAAATLRRAIELGHVPSIEVRGPWPEHGDPHPKVYFRCTCGYEARATRTEKAAREKMAWHLGRAIGEGKRVADLNGAPAQTHPPSSGAEASQARERAEPSAQPAPDQSRSA